MVLAVGQVGPAAIAVIATWGKLPAGKSEAAGKAQQH